MDFYQIKEKTIRSGLIEIYPDFKVTRAKDLMVRGKGFYAIWDAEKNLWSTDEYDVQRLVDKELMEYKERMAKRDETIRVKFMSEFSANSWTQYRNYLSHLSDNSKQLDTKIIFANTPITKKDYASKRLPYNLEEGSIESYDELMNTLYDQEERDKLEWAIGSIISGDAKDIQKFIVLYGEAGGGKSTFLNILQKLFEGYYTTFEAKALTSTNNSFATEAFRYNPLVAIQHDGDLSKIEDNTKLNSIVSHEEMTMNEKYKPSYTSRVNCMLFMATNKPVKITDGKSGIIRRLIDVRTSGRKLSSSKYHALVSRIDFELGAIAFHCLKKYEEMGKNYYSGYRPLDMMLQTDVFFNFIEENYYTFSKQNGSTLSQAYEMYKTYCEDSLVDFKLPKHKFREEFKNYFKHFDEVTRIEGKQVRSYYSGFLSEKFKSKSQKEIPEKESWLDFEVRESKLDILLKNSKAQYAGTGETPDKKWEKVTTLLKDIDTTKLHYVLPPENHIVIDFDIKDSEGNKSLEKNIQAASEWPPTYAEFSKSTKGIHLHYIYLGDDIESISNLFAEGIEIKKPIGLSSIRRQLTKCNNIEIETLKGGSLPHKEEKKMIIEERVKSEKGLRDLIIRNLRKEIHPGTKPSIDFIYTILEEAYTSGMKYDVRDLRQKVFTFAANSSHQPDYCIKLVNKMHFNSEKVDENPQQIYKDDKLAFFDVEVFPNLLMINWKYEGEDNQCVHMINPEPSDLEDFLKLKLVGFNCRRYDNHIIYARYLGYSIEEIYKLSAKIVGDDRDSYFNEAYNLSYLDVYDMSSEKKSLKKFQIDLGIHHEELGYPWFEPVPEENWDKVAKYCDNDVTSLEVVFNDRKEDYIARQILAKLSGLSINDTTQSHAAKIIFGADQKPQSKFVYTDLSLIFPGYEFINGKSYYRGEETGEGGYVYAEPGIYENVALLDVASMHPTSIEILNLFGPYTEKYSEIKKARLAIKHKDFDLAKTMLNGTLEPFLSDVSKSKELAYALKLVINLIYGLTSAKFDTKFRDPRNKDNIVAKRGALFMIDLKHAVQEKGYKVAHIKTDSIKIPNADQEIIDFVFEFGKKYGYEFEHEDTYSKFCLVNDAVYVAKSGDIWSPTGAQFAHPYVFKTLFSREAVMFKDLCEARSVKTAIYLDYNEDLEKDEHKLVFVGKTGLFTPVKDGNGGGKLVREKDGKYYSVTGSKDYRWLESEKIEQTHSYDIVDMRYFDKLLEEAKETILNYTDNLDSFIS